MAFDALNQSIIGWDSKSWFEYQITSSFLYGRLTGSMIKLSKKIQFNKDLKQQLNESLIKLMLN